MDYAAHQSSGQTQGLVSSIFIHMSSVSDITNGPDATDAAASYVFTVLVGLVSA